MKSILLVASLIVWKMNIIISSSLNKNKAISIYSMCHSQQHDLKKHKKNTTKTQRMQAVDGLYFT